MTMKMMTKLTKSTTVNKYSRIQSNSGDHHGVTQMKILFHINIIITSTSGMC